MNYHDVFIVDCSDGNAYKRSSLERSFTEQCLKNYTFQYVPAPAVDHGGSLPIVLTGSR